MLNQISRGLKSNRVEVPDWMDFYIVSNYDWIDWVEVEERIWIKNSFSFEDRMLICFASSESVLAKESQIKRGSGAFSNLMIRVENMYSLIQQIVCIFWMTY